MKFLLYLVYLSAACRISAQSNENQNIDSETQSLTSWIFLENSILKLGVDAENAGAIGYLSEPGGENVVNTYDDGRWIQASYYGGKDGSTWNGHPWRYNPVQVGSWQNFPSKLNHINRPLSNVITTTVTPRNWGGQQLLHEVVMKSIITLNAYHVHIQYSVVYNGEDQPVYNQELPAAFFHRKYSQLVYYKGTRPWTRDNNLVYANPGQPDKALRDSLPEKWVAYINPSTQRGIGIYSPSAFGFTSYCVGNAGSKLKSDCCYVAPIGNFALKKGKTFTHEVYFMMGTVHDMRYQIYQLAKKAPSLDVVSDDFGDDE